MDVKNRTMVAVEIESKVESMGVRILGNRRYGHGQENDMLLYKIFNNYDFVLPTLILDDLRLMLRPTTRPPGLRTLDVESQPTTYSRQRRTRETHSSVLDSLILYPTREPIQSCGVRLISPRR